MKITGKDVEHVALLSRLALTAEDQEKYTQSLDAILGYMERLNTLDTSKVEPTAHVLPLHNVFREDKVQPSMSKELVLANAPHEENGCFRVPKIV